MWAQDEEGLFKYKSTVRNHRGKNGTSENIKGKLLNVKEINHKQRSWIGTQS
jgi:hypothetical protein